MNTVEWLPLATLVQDQLWSNASTTVFEPFRYSLNIINYEHSVQANFLKNIGKENDNWPLIKEIRS